jgi:hypothetical protein
LNGGASSAEADAEGTVEELERLNLVRLNLVRTERKAESKWRKTNDGKKKPNL